MKKKIILGGSLFIVIFLMIIAFKVNQKESGKVSIETSKVKMGSVSNTITATGTVQAIKIVNVGTQVSGIVDKIYVDFNSHVKAGDLLAELDKKTLKTSLENSEANLENAKANMTYQTANYGRIKALADKNLVAQGDYDQAIFEFTKAKSTLKTAQLDYDRSKINLNYASIHSPIDGVVLERAVDEGQTVAASFSTPTLFTIANDLTQMQVEASIDEADIGKVGIGQRVSFTVDAFSDLKFDGQIVQIRLQPITKSNVVTYTVIVKAPNPDMKLKPGMTASITVFVDEANNVLTIASKALHFTPDDATLKNYMLQNQLKVDSNGINDKKTDSTKQMVWVKTAISLHQVSVKIGIDDDINAQILEGLKEGDEVVLALNSASSGKTSGQTSSPFMPKPPSNNKNSSSTKKQ
jgi:HlyD family secretion protein